MKEIKRNRKYGLLKTLKEWKIYRTHFEVHEPKNRYKTKNQQIKLLEKNMHEGMTINLIQIGIGHTKLTPYDIPSVYDRPDPAPGVAGGDLSSPYSSSLPGYTVLGPAYLGPSCNTITTVQSG